MRKKNNKKLIGIGILSLMIISLFIFMGVPQIFLTFEEGWEPYGESTNQVIGLETEAEGDLSKYEIVRESEYYTIKKLAYGKYGFIYKTLENPHRYQEDRSLPIYGSDLKLKFDVTPYHTVKIIPNKDLDNKDYQAEISIGGYSTAGGSQGYISATGLNEREVGRRTTVTYKAVSSPISDQYTIYFNDIKQRVINTNNFEPSISVRFESGAHTGGVIPVTIEDSWREQFGCTKKPDEQYYIKVFNEREEFGLNDLPYWNKFCLTQPVTIYTPSGSATTEEPLIGMAQEDKTYQVPPGQIWAVEYIGEIQDPETTCESGEIYDLENEQCIVRTMISFDFGENETGYIETEPIVYEKEDIETHQELEGKNKFLFEHIIKDGESSENIFEIGDVSFVSNLDEQFSFNYDGKSYSVYPGKRINLDDYLFIEVEEIEKDYDYELKEWDNAKIKYKFTIDTSFLIPSIENDTIKIINDYDKFKGGLTITKTDALDKTTIENIPFTFEKGINIYEVEENLREIKVRPYIIIETPEYSYQFDTQRGVSSNPTFIEDLFIKDNLKVNWVLISIIGILFIILTGLIIKFSKKSK